MNNEERERQVDFVLEGFNQIISQDYADMLMEENLEHTQLLFDVFYAGATSGLAFIQEWNSKGAKR